MSVGAAVVGQTAHVGSHGDKELRVGSNIILLQSGAAKAQSSGGFFRSSGKGRCKEVKLINYAEQLSASRGAGRRQPPQ